MTARRRGCTREERIQQEIRDAVVAVNYIARAAEKGQDVSRLAEKWEKQSALLVRRHACFHCGAVLTDPQSIEAWRVDGLGPDCRVKLAGRAHRYYVDARVAV